MILGHLALVAAALFAYIIANLSAEDFLGWGWRYPFFVAFAINVVALFARLRIVVTPEYTQLFETRELQPQPILETLRQGGRNIVIGAFAPLASFALFHMVTVFPLSWVFLYTQEGPARFLMIDGDIGRSIGHLLDDALQVRGKVVSIDGVQLQELDYVDVGAMITPPGVVPVVIKSLLFS